MSALARKAIVRFMNVHTQDRNIISVSIVISALARKEVVRCMNVHTGQQFHECNYCDKRFNALTSWGGALRDETNNGCVGD